MRALSWVLGFGIGAVVVVANFWALDVTVRLILQPGARAPRLLAALGFVARLMMVAVLVGLAIRYLPVSPVAVVAGVSVVPLALLVKTAIGSVYKVR